MTEEARKQGREVGGIGIRSASWLAWSVCTLSLALTALGYLVIARNLSLDAPVYFYWLEPTTIAIGYSVIGAIIASRLPDHPIGWICCAIGFMGAVEHFSSEYAIYALVAHPEALVGGKLMLWLSGRQLKFVDTSRPLSTERRGIGRRRVVSRYINELANGTT